ncbi:MAG: radical SAM protein [Chloroflexota bacterium]
MTYGCNCACEYCYEVGVRQGVSGSRMTSDVSEKIYRWLEKYVDLRGTRHLDLCFHGGEPMLNFAQIKQIGLRVKHMCSKNGINSFSIVTNGTLLTPGRVEHLVNSGVEFAMITLDGPQPIHDIRRPFLSGQGTFDIVLRHIAQAADKLKIHLLMNVDKHNCKSAEELADVLVKHGLQDKLYGVCVAFVEPTKPLTEHCRLYDMPRDELASYNVSINKVFIESGFKIRDLINLGFCTMNSDNSFIFDPRGDIYKCITGVGDEHFKVGSVNDDFNILAIRASQFVENEPCNHNPDCCECAFLPMCKGGCRHESYVRYGNMATGVCMLDYYSVWVPKIVKEIYTGMDKNAATKFTDWMSLTAS